VADPSLWTPWGSESGLGAHGVTRKPAGPLTTQCGRMLNLSHRAERRRPFVGDAAELAQAELARPGAVAHAEPSP
jgi:hypothetical protein